MRRIDKVVKENGFNPFSKFENGLKREQFKGFAKRRRTEEMSDVDLIKQSGQYRVSKDDPLALQKLHQKLASLLALEENMVRTNEFLKNKDRAGLLQYGYSAEGVEELFMCGPGKQLGFSEQELANMAKEIIDVRKRIEPHGAQVEAGADISADEHKASFRYPDTPISCIRQLLGARGAVWRLSPVTHNHPVSLSLEAFEAEATKITYH